MYFSNFSFIFDTTFINPYASSPRLDQAILSIQDENTPSSKEKT